MTPKLALDMDGVLAASHQRVIEYLGEDCIDFYEDVPHWDWPIHQWGKENFIGSFEPVWDNHWKEIEPMEPDLSETVNRLRENYEVHIVTVCREDEPAVSRGKIMWLMEQGIDPDGFVPVDPDKTKATLGYDAYIDDKPTLPAKVNEQVPGASVYVRDHSYNREAEGTYTRVETIGEVLEPEQEEVKVRV